MLRSSSLKEKLKRNKNASRRFEKRTQTYRSLLKRQMVRQALFIDSKAEKENRSATIQMSQTSMWVRQRRSGRAVNEKGLLPEISEYGNNHYLTTTCLVPFLYKDEAGIHHLKEVKITAIPNGKLQDRRLVLIRFEF